jgi:hypothetical protein
MKVNNSKTTPAISKKFFHPSKNSIDIEEPLGHALEIAAKISLSEWIRSTIHDTLQRENSKL